MEQAPNALRLRNGVHMPAIGLGTWKMPEGPDTVAAVRAALDMGYRLMDTATMYGNEQSIGRAVRESGIPREEVFVTTKLWPVDFFQPEKALEESLGRLGLEYVDLYLVHWPIPMMPKTVWPALETMYGAERARAIGVSNYGIGDIESLLSYARIPPMVNQIKFSPFDYAEEVLKCCHSHDIVVEAYSPLTRGVHLSDPTLQRLAAAHQKTPAQVMLRWCIEHGAVPLPKSNDPARMKENLDVLDFSLTADEMQQLNALSD